MATAAMTALQTITLGASASSVTFSSIPATYRDLALVVNGNSNEGQAISLYMNGDTGANYNTVLMYGNGTSAQSFTQTDARIGAVYAEPNTVIAQIMDYSATDKHKTVLTRTNAAGTTTFATAYRWSNTAAVTSLNIAVLGTFSSGCTFSLFGIAS